MRVPRNELSLYKLCPCGSSKASKKCCGKRPPEVSLAFSPEVLADHHAAMGQIAEEEHRFGHIKPMIHANYRGNKFVAIGDEVMWSDRWKTFPDFLFDYIKRVLDRDWGVAELNKPDNERHPILQWYVHACHYQRQQKLGPNGLYAMAPDGITSAYVLLAYDLYVLRHHQNLQRVVVERLKHPDQFQGARYELFVTTTLIRAGFDIAFEDESDSTTKHPEFIATHRQLGESIAVEAKSRHRPGILGQPGETQEPEDLKLGVRRLLNKAIDKHSVHPLAVFIDLNVPPERANPNELGWMDEIKNDLARCAVETNGAWPFSLLIVTNHPHHYGLSDERDPRKLNYVLEPDSPMVPIREQLAVEAIVGALQQYGTIPNAFPKDPLEDPRQS